MKPETLRKIAQADAAVESARRRFDSVNEERTRRRVDAMESYLGGDDAQDAQDDPAELAAAKQELARALRSAILNRRDAVPGYEQCDVDNAAGHAAALAAAGKELDDEIAKVKAALRPLGFAEIIDAPRPVSFCGSFAPAGPTLWEQFLASNSHIRALRARRQSLLRSNPAVQALGNALAIKLLEKRLTALLAPPKVMRRVVGFPMVFIDRAEPEHEAPGQWAEWEARQASVPVEATR